MHQRQIIKSKWTVLSVLLACGVGLTACVGDASVDELNDDPTGAMAGEELGDDGPPASEDVIDAEDGDESYTTSSEGVSTSSFQLPFPCGQVWAGQTRSNHSPVNSVDFNRADDLGDTVVASAAGTVTRVGNEGNVSYGRWIEISHGDGYATRYAHLSAQNVTVGQKVAKGQKIGLLGNTGGSTGPHLHFELRRNGVAIKPVFNGATALFFGTKNYTSKNACSSGGGGSSGGASGSNATVNTNGAPLTIRSGASTDSKAVGSVSDGEKVKITCQKKGTKVTGTYGTSTLWDYIGNGYIADAYVMTGSDGQVAPTCK
jgi:hypothetical protein